MRIDLHIHTTASDGVLEPAEVVRLARAGGLDLIAVTDHDTTAGVAAAREACARLGVGLVAGCELSTTHRGREVHVLGLGVDPEAPALRAWEFAAAERRRGRMALMVERLAALGCPVSLARVHEVAGPMGVVGRPHLARVLVEAGHVQDVPAAFDRLIGDGGPAFEPTSMAEPTEAVATLLEAGGVPVWAHPPGDLLDTLLPGLVRAGLGGLEAHRPGHTATFTRRLVERARTTGLVVSGGSDWHDPERNDPLGSFAVGETEVGGLLNLLRERAASTLPDGVRSDRLEASPTRSPSLDDPRGRG